MRFHFKFYTGPNWWIDVEDGRFAYPTRTMLMFLKNALFGREK